MDNEEMEAYLDFSLMAERNQTQNITLNQRDKNTDGIENKGNWNEANELAVSASALHGHDLSNEYLISKSNPNVQFTMTDNFLLVSGRQGNEDTKSIDSNAIMKMEVGSLFEQVHQTKSMKDGETFPKVVDNSAVFNRKEENDKQLNYTTWNYNDEIVVLNLSRGEKSLTEPVPGTSTSTDNIVVQFESDLQSEAEMHIDLMQKAKDESQYDNKNQSLRSDTKPLISQLSDLSGESDHSKGGNKVFHVGDMIISSSGSTMLDQDRGDNSNELIDINNYSDEGITEVKCENDFEPKMYISKKRKVDINVNNLSESHFNHSKSQQVKLGRNFPVKPSLKVKSPIKMTFKKRKYEMEDLCKRDNVNETMGENDIQEDEKCCPEKIETSTSNDSDYDAIHGDLGEENVPLDYSMHATLVRQNLSKSGMTDPTTSKHLSDTDATTSDQDQESFCSSLKLVSVNEMEQKKSSGSQIKSGNESSTADDMDESDAKEDETEQKEIGQVDKFVLERLIKSCQEKKKSKLKTTESDNNSKGRIFNCDTCSKTFTRKSTWRHHVKIHVDDKFKECKICGKKLKFSGNMLSHLKTHTGDRPFKCDFCEKTFTRAASLYTHVRSHTGEKAFLCEICGKGFADKSHYRRHLRIHSGIKPFKCEVCEMAFTQSWSLKSHMLSHAEEKPHICSLCGKGYTQKAYLESHMRSHTGERPFSCETCGKSFSDSSCMRRHAKSHLGERSFICELCGKAFGRGWNLTVHMRIHYDDKRFECYICGKAFVQKINLDKHILTHPVEPCD